MSRAVCSCKRIVDRGMNMFTSYKWACAVSLGSHVPWFRLSAESQGTRRLDVLPVLTIQGCAYLKYWEAKGLCIHQPMLWSLFWDLSFLLDCGTGLRNKLCHRVCLISVSNCAYSITWKNLPILDLPRGTQGPEAAASTAVFVYGTGPAACLLTSLCWLGRPSPQQITSVLCLSPVHILFSSVGTFFMCHLGCVFKTN